MNRDDRDRWEAREAAEEAVEEEYQAWKARDDARAEVEERLYQTWKKKEEAFSQACAARASARGIITCIDCQHSGDCSFELILIRDECAHFAPRDSWAVIETAPLHTRRTGLLSRHPRTIQDNTWTEPI